MVHRTPTPRPIPRFLRSLITLGAALVAGAWSPDAAAQQAAPTPGERVLVQVSPAVDADLEGPFTGPFLGVPAIDRVSWSEGVRAVERLLPVEAGRAAPEAFVSLGLGRILVLDLGRVREDAAAVAERYAALEEVTYAEVDGVVQATVTPNDPLWSRQWGMKRVGMPGAWDVVTDARGVPVAVVDSGVDLDHQDLEPNLWRNPGEVPGNGIDDDRNGYVDDVRGWDFVGRDATPDDLNGHGTHVAGTIAARGNNSRQVAGACWNAEIMVVRVLGAGGGGSMSDLARGITYLADNNARASNYSLGGSYSQSVANAVSYAAAADVLQVAAAGNNGSQNKYYPAALSNVMGIISTDSRDRRSSFSNYGDWCDLAAPGESILSSWVGGGTATLSGTSMASPHVAGVATLLRAVAPELPWRMIRHTLRNSAVDLGSAGFDKSFAFGRLDGNRAVKTAAALSASAADVADGGQVQLFLEEPDAAGFFYVLLPTTSGRQPGLDLDAFDPADWRNLAINLDRWTRWSLALPNAGVFQDFVGSLDGNGRAQAMFRVPRGAFIGETFDFAFVTLDPANPARIATLSAPVRVLVTD